jgi:predicted kinase
MDDDELASLLARGGSLLVPVGLPGSGKSTMARRLVAHGLIDSTSIVSTDALREAVGGRRDWLGDEELVIRHSREIAAARLRHGLTVYLDATNIMPDDRKSVFALASATGGKVLAVRFSETPDLCRRRREEAGVTYADEVWNDLVAHLAEIDWARFPAAWVHSAVLDRMLPGDA